MNKRKKELHFTPEKTRAWGLALYPFVILILVVFMVLSGREVTTDIIGLFIGLITAGSVQAVIQKRGDENGNTDGSSDNLRNIRLHGSQELEADNRRRTNDPDNGLHGRIRFRPS